MKSTRNMSKISLLFIITSVILTSCGSTVPNAPAPTSTEGASADSAATSASDSTAPTEPSDASTTSSTQELSTKNNSLIKHHYTEHEYNHGSEGYYNLADDVDFELTAQLSGTCWICASANAMMTAYQLDHDDKIELDQLDLLNILYNDDKEEGIFLTEGTDKEKYGGSGHFVACELSNGFDDYLVLDHAISAKNWTMDEYKDGIRKYGGLYIGIPDPASKKGTYDGYFTMNCPAPTDGDFDHSIVVLGWDDSFPKDYFHEKATQDGAWITFNSNYPLGFFYISYDTPFDQVYDTPLFLSVTDEYSKVLSHDCGPYFTDPVKTGDTTTAANVFKGKGSLSAVGTFVTSDDIDLTVQILTPDFSKCLYTQDVHADLAGYHVFDLDEPVDVDEYAVAITYPEGVPVEGQDFELDTALYTHFTSKPGESFIQVGGKWLDLSKEATWKQLGCETNNACIRALYKD